MFVSKCECENLWCLHECVWVEDWWSVRERRKHIHDFKQPFILSTQESVPHLPSEPVVVGNHSWISLFVGWCMFFLPRISHFCETINWVIHRYGNWVFWTKSSLCISSFPSALNKEMIEAQMHSDSLVAYTKMVDGLSSSDLTAGAHGVKVKYFSRCYKRHKYAHSLCKLLAAI